MSREFNENLQKNYIKINAGYYSVTLKLTEYNGGVIIEFYGLVFFLKEKKVREDKLGVVWLATS